MNKNEILVVLIQSGSGNKLIKGKRFVEVRENSLTTSLNVVEGEYTSEAAGPGGAGTRSLQKFPLFGNRTD